MPNGQKARLSARDILNLEKKRATETETFVMSAWGCDVTIKRVSLKEVRALGEHVKSDDAETMGKAMIAAALIEPVFTLEEIEELYETGTAGPFTELLSKVQTFNNLSTTQSINGVEVDTVMRSFPVQPAE